MALGRALYQQQRYDEAKSLLDAAKSYGESYKWLGYIALKQGGKAGSNAQFSKYLKTNPKDAALIQKVMDGQ